MAEGGVHRVEGLGLVKLRTAVPIAPLGPLPEFGRVVDAGDVAVAAIGPVEWLLLGTREAVQSRLAAVAAALEGTLHLALDLSAGHSAFDVTGADAAARIAAHCPLDLRALAPGAVARSLIADIHATVLPVAGGYRIIVDRSEGPAVAALLALAP